MTAIGTPVLQLVCFGDLEQGSWGVAWGELAITAEGPIPASLEGGGSDEAWRLSGEGVQLDVEPEGEAVSAAALGGFDQLCRVSGALSGQTVDARGRRAARATEALQGLDSIRDFCAWFAPGDGVALTSLRPRGAGGHDQDHLTAALFEPAGATPVADPRFSTTYDAGGAPSRIGLELWLEQQDDESEPFPRRAAGDSLGPAMTAEGNGQQLLARAFRCFGHELQGLGVYVLARPLE